MSGLAKYLDNMYSSSKIPFMLSMNDEVVYVADPNYSEEYILESRFCIGINKFIIKMPANFKNSMKLIEFCIKDRYKDNGNNSEKILKDLLDDIAISKDKLEEIMPDLRRESFMILISLNSKIEEAIDIIKSIYADIDTIIISNNEGIILLGIFENIEEHLSSISETLYTSIYEKCYITYENIVSYSDMKQYFDDMVHKVKLAKKYNSSSMILGRNSLIFEDLIDSMKSEIKNKILDKFSCGFANLDNDMIKTIEVFFELDLNLSEASKRLYVHRNTLIYRLDKIQKYTTYDIRKFNDALIFKIAFFLWTQSRMD